MNRHEQFETLAKEVLLTLARTGELRFAGDARTLVDTALILTEDFLNKLQARREKMNKFDGLLPEEIQMLRVGKLVQAVKSVRERTSMDLKSAKKFVDQARGEIELYQARAEINPYQAREEINP